MSRDAGCSTLSQHVPLAGSAPQAQRWWLIETTGAWSARPLTDSPIEWIGRWGDVSGPAGRVILIRRVGNHPATTHASRRVFTFAPGDDFVMTKDIQDAQEDARARLAHPNLAQAPSEVDWQITSDFPKFLLCTNGKRDLCCAQEGRALLQAWSSLAPIEGDVWECTHLGGHRFAPTGLAIPSGYVFGRLTPQIRPWPLQQEKPMTPAAFIRGRSDLPPPAQVADVALRHALGYIQDNDITSCRVIEHRPGNAYAPLASATVDVSDVTGNRWRVYLREQDVDAVVTSCGSPGERQRAWVAIDIESLRS